MGNTVLSTNSNLTTSKEAIRKEIRHALSNKGDNRFPNLDLNEDFVMSSQDIAKDFILKFRSLGGKFVPCSKDQLQDTFLKLLKKVPNTQLLNTMPQFSKFLSENGINHTDSIDPANPASAAIVFSDALIANSGAILFSPKNSIYPSVKNLASDLIIVSFARFIVPNLGTAMANQMQRNNGELYNLFEIITPSKPEIRDNNEVYSPTSPRMILVLIY